MIRETRQMGTLQVHTVGAENPRLAVILFHGFGAPGTDLVPIGEQLAILPGLDNARFYFPEAPRLLGGGFFEQRAWWMIDVAALEDSIATGRPRDRRTECPEELPELRECVAALTRELLHETGLSLDALVYGGFSQGGMLATDVVLHLDARPSALAVFSGTLLCEDTWRERAREHRGLGVFQSHGRQDPLLPFAGATRLRDLLTEAGLDVEFVPFDGQHEIPTPAMSGFVRLLQDRIAAAGAKP